VIIRTLDLHRWLADITLFEQEVFSVILHAAPAVEEDATIVLLVRPDNTYVLEPLNNSVTIESALRTLYEDSSLKALICYLGSEPWGWYEETCRFAEDGLHTTFVDAETIYPYDRIILFEFTSSGDTVFIEQIPPDVFSTDRAVDYDPTQLINPGAPLPLRYYTMFNPRPLLPR
jgi:hypothetical protein